MEPPLPLAYPPATFDSSKPLVQQSWPAPAELGDSPAGACQETYFERLLRVTGQGSPLPLTATSSSSEGQGKPARGGSKGAVSIQATPWLARPNQPLAGQTVAPTPHHHEARTPVLPTTQPLPRTTAQLFQQPQHSARFQQLLRAKMAAEQRSTPPAATPPPQQQDRFAHFAQLQQTDCVVNRDFASQYYTSNPAPIPISASKPPPAPRQQQQQQRPQQSKEIGGPNFPSQPNYDFSYGASTGPGALGFQPQPPVSDLRSSPQTQFQQIVPVVMPKEEQPVMSEDLSNSFRAMISGRIAEMFAATVAPQAHPGGDYWHQPPQHSTRANGELSAGGKFIDSRGAENVQAPPAWTNAPLMPSAHPFERRMDNASFSAPPPPPVAWDTTPQLGPSTPYVPTVPVGDLPPPPSLASSVSILTPPPPSHAQLYMPSPSRQLLPMPPFSTARTQHEAPEIRIHVAPESSSGDSSTQRSSVSVSPKTSPTRLKDYGIRMFTNLNGSICLPGTGRSIGFSDGAAHGNGNGNGEGGLNLELAMNGSGGGAGGSGGEGGGGGGSEAGGSGGSGSGGSGGSGGGDKRGDGGGGDDGGDGSGGGGGGGGGGTPRGKKLSLACHFCRRRKLKCDGHKPTCDNCSKRNEVCTYDESVRRRGPGKRTREMRERAAREAEAAGLVNPNSTMDSPSGLGMDDGDGQDDATAMDEASQALAIAAAIERGEAGGGYGGVVEGYRDHVVVDGSNGVGVGVGELEGGGGGGGSEMDLPPSTLAELGMAVGQHFGVVEAGDGMGGAGGHGQGPGGGVDAGYAQAWGMGTGEDSTPIDPALIDNEGQVGRGGGGGGGGMKRKSEVGDEGRVAKMRELDDGVKAEMEGLH